MLALQTIETRRDAVEYLTGQWFYLPKTLWTEEQLLNMPTDVLLNLAKGQVK